MDVEDHLTISDDEDFVINTEIATEDPKESLDEISEHEEGEEYEDVGINDDDDNDNLEKVVFGCEDNMEDEFDEYIVTRKRKGDEIESIPKKAKWHDEDDNEKISNEALKPDWAKKGHTEEEDASDDEDKINWRTGDYISSSKFIARNQLSYRKCVNINKECSTKGKIRVLEFLKSAPIAIVAGADQSLSIFQVDGKTNLKVQTILFENFPVFRAQFSADGSEIILGSLYPSIFSYNMNTGKSTKFQLKENNLVKNTRLFATSPDGKYIALGGSFGHTHILSAKSKKCLQLLKAESESIDAFAFSPDGTELYTHGDRGVVHVWNMKSFLCTFSFQDEGCTHGTSIIVSPDGKFLATGSSTGIVNVYDRSTLRASRATAAKFQLPRPKPLKVVENLVSACTSLTFNHTSELLAMASNYTDNAVKMLHIRSMTVYANFPSVTKNIGQPFSIGFSPNSGYFAIGNQKGYAQLCRLQHYSSY